MKFRYYITDLFNGQISGSNNEDQAKELAQCEEYFVVDTETGQWLTPNGPVDIKGYT